MQIVKIGNRYRVKDCVPRLDNFWIDADPERQEINIPATGDIGPATAADLVRAIQYATDLANGLVTLESAPPVALERQDWYGKLIDCLQTERKMGANKVYQVGRIQTKHRL